MGNTKQLLKTTAKVASATCVGLGLIGIGAILASASAISTMVSSFDTAQKAAKDILKEEKQEVVK